MKRWYAAILLLLAAQIYIFGIISFSDKDQTVSLIEKRTLKARPVFSENALTSGSYTKDYEEYYSDTFPLRDVFMSINRFINGFYYFSPGGDSNMLVLAHDNNNIAAGGESYDDVSKFMQQTQETASPSTAPSPSAEAASPSASPSPSLSPEPPALDNPDEDQAVRAGSSIIILGNRAMEIPTAIPASMKRYAAAVTSIHDALPDCRVFSLVTPNAGEFYSPETFHTGSHSQKDMIDKTYAQMSGVTTVDAYSAIRQHIDEYLYFRTDHHWTALGAYYAYTALCQSAGFKPVELKAFQTGRYDSFLGTMYNWTTEYPQSKALKDDPDYIDYYLPVVNSTAEYFSTPAMTDGIKIPVVDSKISKNYSNKYLCFIRGDTPICKITTDNKNGKKIAVIKESYANAMIPFLTSHYEEIYVIDPRKFNSKDFPTKLNLPSFVKEHGIGDVLVINYPFVINYNNFIGLIENLVTAK
jgi:hypothetical protein